MFGWLRTLFGNSMPGEPVQALFIKSGGEWIKFIPEAKEDEMSKKFKSALLSGLVRLPPANDQMTFSIGVVAGQVKIDFGEYVLQLPPDGARQFAAIVLQHADIAEGKT